MATSSTTEHLVAKFFKEFFKLHNFAQISITFIQHLK